jgi:hypothetical protein
MFSRVRFPNVPPNRPAERTSLKKPRLATGLPSLAPLGIEQGVAGTVLAWALFTECAHAEGDIGGGEAVG